MELVLKDITQQHRSLVAGAWESLGTWRKFVIGVDGRDGSGKSTLARFLAWQMGMPVIETDLLLIPNEQNRIIYEDGILNRLIEARLKDDRPVIVEGLVLLQALQQLCFEPNYLVYLHNESFEGSNRWEDVFSKYEDDYKPRERANFVFSWREN